MAEYKKEIGIAGAIAIAAALGVGLFAIAAFPNGPATSPVGGPRVLLGYVSTTDVTCSLATGSCTMTIINNSTVPLIIESCRMSLISRINGTVTTYDMVNGTAGGPAAAGIPAEIDHARGSTIPGSCTVPMTELSLQASGSPADGLFLVKLASSWYGYPAGTETIVGFDGIWS
ncbi:MAG TPA: hypothetical protein VGR53_04290 [Nitrososphaerales archaeon]|nr:hypothetical protein [Nitrososphaerales archaeon]